MILLQTLALVLWNVGSRDPLAIVRDIASIREPRKTLYALASLVIGLMFVAAATVLMISVIGSNPDLFVPFILVTFMVAIGVDALIGDQLRRAARL